MQDVTRSVEQEFLIQSILTSFAHTKTSYCVNEHLVAGKALVAARHALHKVPQDHICSHAILLFAILQRTHDVKIRAMMLNLSPGKVPAFASLLL